MPAAFHRLQRRFRNNSCNAFSASAAGLYLATFSGKHRERLVSTLFDFLDELLLFLLPLFAFQLSFAQIAFCASDK
jgi:hypothetical protein